MSEEPQRVDLAKLRVVYSVAGMESVPVRSNIEYAPGLTLDLYQPVETPAPVVVFVLGFPDPEGKYKETGPAVSWARLAAASGMAAIVYATREPATDLLALLDFLRRHAASLQIDATRIALSASSGNGPCALWSLMQPAHGLRCAVFQTAYLLDLDGKSVVAEAARTYGFASPCAGKSLANVRPDLPLFLTRAGRDQFTGLNESMDAFAVEALRRNLPVSLVNHPEGPHGFELFDNSETSRRIIRMILEFLRAHVMASPSR